MAEASQLVIHRSVSSGGASEDKPARRERVAAGRTARLHEAVDVRRLVALHGRTHLAVDLALAVVVRRAASHGLRADVAVRIEPAKRARPRERETAVGTIRETVRGR